MADGPGPRARPQAPEPHAGDGMAAEIQAQGEEMKSLVGGAKVSAGGKRMAPGDERRPRPPRSSFSPDGPLTGAALADAPR